MLKELICIVLFGHDWSNARIHPADPNPPTIAPADQHCRRCNKWVSIDPQTQP